MLNLPTLDALAGHPVLGASWEGFVIEQVIAALDPVETGFYRTSAGAEIDLVMKLRGETKPIAVEVKYSAAPKPAKGFWTALDDLGIERAYVIHPGRDDYPLDSRVTGRASEQGWAGSVRIRWICDGGETSSKSTVAEISATILRT